MNSFPELLTGHGYLLEKKKNNSDPGRLWKSFAYEEPSFAFQYLLNPSVGLLPRISPSKYPEKSLL